MTPALLSGFVEAAIEQLKEYGSRIEDRQGEFSFAFAPSRIGFCFASPVACDVNSVEPEAISVRDDCETLVCPLRKVMATDVSRRFWMVGNVD